MKTAPSTKTISTPYGPSIKAIGVLGLKLMLTWYESAAQAEQNAFYRTKKALFVLENEHFEFSKI